MTLQANNCRKRMGVSNAAGEAGAKECRRQSDDLFSRDWEVFVVKRDQKTGKLTGKTLCCALEPA